MDTIYKLIFTFATMEGTTMTLTISNVNPDVNVAAVKAFASGVVSNNVIFESQPVLQKSAKLVTQTTTEYDLDA